jgi:hypothetical protein
LAFPPESIKSGRKRAEGIAGSGFVVILTKDRHADTIKSRQIALDRPKQRASVQNSIISLSGGTRDCSVVSELLVQILNQRDEIAAEKRRSHLNPNHKKFELEVTLAT